MHRHLPPYVRAAEAEVLPIFSLQFGRFHPGRTHLDGIENVQAGINQIRDDLPEQDRQRIGLLAGGTTEDPDAEGLASALTKLRHDFAGHYNRPDIFQLHVNRAAPHLYAVHGADGVLPGEPPARLEEQRPSALLQSPTPGADDGQSGGHSA